ncbi:MAG: Rrf2 family transcriptional regulator [Calditrichaeota bacterium]|nr:Rrf2 family transcriptional regulator [Calditrichota bacterium]
MIRLGKKVEYALIALQHISPKNPGELTSARELSEQYRISYELMGKILQKLARKKLIKSVQGVKGGYFLAKPINKINLAEVVEAIEGPLRMTDCVGNNEKKVCVRFDVCNVKSKVKLIQKQVEEIFQNIYLGNEN